MGFLLHHPEYSCTRKLGYIECQGLKPILVNWNGNDIQIPLTLIVLAVVIR